jgi:hypothetical protein
MKAAPITAALVIGLAWAGTTSVLATTHSPLIADRASASSLDASLNAVARAPNPPAALKAYHDGLAVAPDSIALRQVFVRRMVAFGLPQMAESQAADVVQCDPQDGLAWGVLAYTCTVRGNTVDALRALVSAVGYAPNDPFVQRTAGQLLGWFDTEADWRQFPVDVRQAVQSVRDRLQDRPTFADVYWVARRTYEVRNDLGLPTTASSRLGPAPVFALPQWNRDEIRPNRTDDRARATGPGQAARGSMKRPQRLATNGSLRNVPLADNPLWAPPMPEQPAPNRAIRKLSIAVRHPTQAPSLPATPTPALAQAGPARRAP